MHSRSLGHNLLTTTNRVGQLESRTFPFTQKLRSHELTGGSEGALGFDVMCSGMLDASKVACGPTDVQQTSGAFRRVFGFQRLMC